MIDNHDSATSAQPAPPGATPAYPALTAQQECWAWRESHAQSFDTTIVHVLRADGHVDEDRLRAALAVVVARHEALRTVFGVGIGGIPMRRVRASADVTLAVRRVSDTSQVWMRIGHWQRHRFDVRVATWSAELLSAGTWSALVFAADEIIFDRWSGSLLEVELAAAYADPEISHRAVSRPVPTPAEVAAGHQYWPAERTEARDDMTLPSPLAIRPERHRPSDIVKTVLANDVVAALRALADEAETELIVVLLAMLKALLYRRGCGPDNTMYLVVSGRTASSANAAIGQFTKFLPVHDRPAGDLPFRAYLATVSTRVAAARAYVAAPAVEFARGRRAASLGAPVAPPRIVLAEEPPATNLQVGELTMRRWPTTSTNTIHDLSVGVSDGAKLTMRWVCRDAAVLSGTTCRLADAFATLAATVAADPDAALGTLPAMADAEERFVRRGSSDGPTRAAPHITLVDLFDAQVRLRPHAAAVVTGDGVVSYDMLARRATAIRALVDPALADQQRPVLLVLDKSVDLLAAQVAILQRGSFYLPLAPEHARTTLADLVTRSGSRLVLTRRRFAADMALPTSVRVVILDQTSEPVSAGRTEVLPVVGPEDLAYAMPTSGSTGTPKLVGVPHRAVVRLVHESATLPLGPDDTTMLVANSSFDAATLEVWGALANGGRVAVPTEATLRDPALLGEAIALHGVTVAFFTVTLFARMVEAAPDRLSRMRHLLVGGETVPPALLAEASRHVPPGVLMNGYGPTENTTFSCCYRLTTNPANLRAVPIGPPISGSDAYVVDERLRPVPVGVPGEIVVGGLGLARGYLNDEALTAERFVPCPWAPERRWYKTGDLGRLLPDGAVEFLGRRDRQVKVRGFRVELGAVETEIVAHPAVHNVLVEAVASAFGQRLMAAVESKLAPTEAQLRGWLAERVPEYMVPARILVFDKLPLTANGKVDRAAVLAAEAARPPLDSGFVAPRSQLEQLVTQIWGGLLGVARVGVDDDFFALGGNSVLVLAACARLREHLDRPVPAHLLFEHPTVRAFALRLGRSDAADYRRHETANRRVQRITQAAEAARDERGRRVS